MKHIKLFLFILFLPLIFVGCNKNALSDSSKILPPENYNMPLEGVWIADKYYADQSSSDISKIKSEMEKIVSFSKNKITFFDDVCRNPKYKIKTVNAQNYFIGNYSIKPESLDIHKDTIQIVTVTYHENFLASFAILDENRILTCKNGTFFRLSKNKQLSSSETDFDTTLDDKDSIESDIAKNSKVTNEYNNSVYPYKLSHQFNSGVLLGLKSYKPATYKIPYKYSTSQEVEPVYRTLWINFNGDSVVSNNELPYILAPRPNGFWKVESKRTVNVDNSYVKDHIYAYPIEKNSEDILNNDISIKKNSYSLANITFVGSDYISLELNNGGYNNSTNTTYKYSFLNTVPLDMVNASTLQAVSIDKLLGEQGIKALKQGAATYLNSLNYDSRQKLENFPRMYNFGLNRKNGKWNLIGRLNHSSEAYKDMFGDFDIPIMASKELIRYDSLYPTWNIIKERVPNALDAYSPPNRNFVLVVTKSQILIYDIVNENLGKKPLKIIPLKSGESVIMSQWSIGKYVKIWDDQVKSLLK